MKLNSILFALGMGVFFYSPVHAQPIVKTIKLTAHISDTIHISKPDGASWYGEEALLPTDRKQTSFSNTFPIRIWSNQADFNMLLVQPLRMVNGGYEMTDARVSVLQNNVERELTSQSMAMKQTRAEADGYDQIYQLKVSAKPPVRTPGGADINGYYRGDLIVLFEPRNNAP
ncbi:fimbrial assembly protein [Herminiimonas sp. KBW02]|uniref:fimbrial assembly protein n=1 Tax=Herminiimonas sp. KBW02 TaxID=2153363 RepID=UPI00131520C3|nr:fimbrial assembly protein [Herminiimonas sp. KBW02]